MTGAEVLEWLAPGTVLAPGTRLRRTLVDGMADVPVPARGDNASQFRAFRAFLACAGNPGPGRLVEPDEGNN